jgi:hypothetical protein
MNFFNRYKKFFLITGFLIIIIVVAYLIIHFFFAPSAAPITISPKASSSINGLPVAGPGDTNNISNPDENNNLPNQNNGNNISEGNKVDSLALGGLTNAKTLTNSPTLNPTLNSSGGIQYYNPNDNRFYTVDKDGNIKSLSDKVFHDVQNVVWAPDKNQAILEYPDGNKTLYNFQTQRQVTLPSHWEDFSFSPDSEEITSKSLGLDSENRWLITSNADGSQTKGIESMGVNADTVYPSWSPNNQIIALYTQDVDFNRQEVFFVGLNGENFKSTIVEGRGFQSEWSKTGDRLLYSVYSTATSLNPRLWIVDAQGDTISHNRQDLSLATWAEKCTFSSNDKVYCAVPETLPQGAGLFPELADQTKDNLYEIDLKTGTKKLIAIPNGAYNISQVMVPDDEKNLYFTDKTSQQIYTIQLP